MQRLRESMITEIKVALMTGKEKTREKIVALLPNPRKKRAKRDLQDVRSSLSLVRCNEKLDV